MTTNNNQMPGLPPGTRQVSHHKGVDPINDHVTVLHVGTADFQLGGPTDYYRLTFAGGASTRVVLPPGVVLPSTRQQIGIDLPMHTGSPQAGLTGVTIEALLAVCTDKLERWQAGDMPCDENSQALAGIQAALAALSHRTIRLAEVQA